MTFELAKAVSLVLHYCIILSLSLWFILRKRVLLTAFLRVYVVLLIWIGITFLFNGCPITLLENWLSTTIYKQPFYPNYGFTSTDAYRFLQHWDLLLPLLLILSIWATFPNIRSALRQYHF